MKSGTLSENSCNKYQYYIPSPISRWLVEKCERWYVIVIHVENSCAVILFLYKMILEVCSYPCNDCSHYSVKELDGGQTFAIYHTLGETHSTHIKCKYKGMEWQGKSWNYLFQKLPLVIFFTFVTKIGICVKHLRVWIKFSCSFQPAALFWDW
jgi:hypothetical protein